MATLHRHHTDHTPSADVSTEPTPVVTVTGALARSLAVLRLGFGLTFLWAFFDKLLALGFSTGRDPVTDNVDRFGDAAWIHGGSPTAGFLGFAAKGPFKDFYNNIAGDAWVDWLFMLALLGIGLALTLGIGMRFAGAAGALLYVMMWSVVLPPANNPVLDEHLLGAVTMVVLALALAGDTWGLGRRWSRIPLVRHNAYLR
jgi:thiosulfate dehydrogenase [quinone] large subunit